MSWKIAFAVALLTAIITALVTAPVADKMSKLHGVSDFEGARGMAIVFIFIPAGFIGGFLLGLLGTKLVHATEWTHFWKAAGVSILLGLAAILCVSALSLLSIPRPLVLKDLGVAIEVEVMVPLVMITPRSREAQQIRMSLYAGDRDNHYVELDTSRFREAEGKLIIPAVIPLRSRSSTRIISFHIEERTWLAFDLHLPPQPLVDEAWSPSAPMRDARKVDRTSPTSEVLLRYRVVAVDAGSGH